MSMFSQSNGQPYLTSIPSVLYWKPPFIRFFSDMISKWVGGISSNDFPCLGNRQQYGRLDFILLLFCQRCVQWLVPWQLHTNCQSTIDFHTLHCCQTNAYCTIVNIDELLYIAEECGFSMKNPSENFNRFDFEKSGHDLLK